MRLIHSAQRGNQNRKMLTETEVKFDINITLSVSSHDAAVKSRKLSSLKKITNKLFNPNFSVLVTGKSNELKTLKNSIDSTHDEDVQMSVIKNTIAAVNNNALELRVSNDTQDL